MSLQIYLPFNGDIKNYGQLSVTTQSTGTITYENGIQYNQCGNLTSNVYIDILNAYEPITHWDDWSVAVWIYPVSKDSHSNTIINSGNWNAINTLWHFALRDYNSSTNKFTSVLVPNTNNWGTANITGLSIPINAWTHLVLTYNFTTKTQKLYINNVLAATYSTYDGTTHGKDTSSYPHLRLGANNYSTGMYSHAKMSDFRMYNHELSLKEINDLYTKTHLSKKGLQIWLPLTGNTNNYGLCNATITTNNITFNANGKLGQCASFNGSDSFIALTHQAINNCFKGSVQPITIAFWIKHTDTNRAIIFGDYGLTGAISFNLELKASSTSDWRYYWAGSPDQSVGSNVAPADGNWHHCAIIYTGTKLKAYKDGILVGNEITLTLSTKNKTTGAWYIGRDSRTGATAFNGFLNDFRIYDYALSENEIKKLVRCPIMHYQLNQFDNYLIRTYHMSGGGVAAGNTKTFLENNEVVQVVAASGNSNYVKFDHANEAFKLTNFLNAGDKFTISYDIKIVSANNKLPQVYATNNSGGYQSTTGDPTLVGEWQRVHCIKTQGSATDGGISVHIGFSGCVGTYLIRHLKLEPGEVTRTYWTPNLRDLEGNIHNGYGNPELKSSINTLVKFGQGNHKSPRYKSALLFGAHQTPYTIADFTNIKAALGNCTISWWEKVTITGNSLPFTGGNTQYYVGAGSTTKDLYDGTNSGANAWLYVDGVKETSPSGTTTRTHTGIKYEQNVWHHYCLVNVNMTNWTKFWIDNYGSSWPTQAYLSDLRIYNSLLTDAEVLELYKMGHVA